MSEKNSGVFAQLREIDFKEDEGFIRCTCGQLIQPNVESVTGHFKDHVAEAEERVKATLTKLEKDYCKECKEARDDDYCPCQKKKTLADVRRNLFGDAQPIKGSHELTGGEK
jgi:hypothetical protein